MPAGGDGACVIGCLFVPFTNPHRPRIRLDRVCTPHSPHPHSNSNARVSLILPTSSNTSFSCSCSVSCGHMSGW